MENIELKKLWKKINMKSNILLIIWNNRNKKFNIYNRNIISQKITIMILKSKILEC